MGAKSVNDDSSKMRPKLMWDLIDGEGFWVERFLTRQDAEDEAERLTFKYDLDIWDPFTGQKKYPWYRVVAVVPGSPEDTIDRTSPY
jgi:hypothetical protein